MSDLRRVPAIWSITRGPALWKGLPVIQPATEDYGATVLEVPGHDTVWGWTPPGDLRAAERYGERLIADVEMRKTTKAKPDAGWTYEIESAELLAALVGGVTSHGWLPEEWRDVLRPFAKQGCVGYPQVYDTDRSTKPRSFLRDCLKQWEAAGFQRDQVVPLLGLSAGPEHVAAWIDECGKLGIPFHLWSLQRAEEMAYTPEESGDTPWALIGVVLGGVATIAIGAAAMFPEKARGGARRARSSLAKLWSRRR
ncbi:MAG: hypothetical protein R3B09_32285 [Nannocystaceae bacterium]